MVTVRNALEKKDLKEETKTLKRKISSKKNTDIVGESDAINEIKALIEKVAQTELEIEQISSQLDAVQINYNTEIYQERSQVTGEIAELEVRLPAIRQRLKETEIRSPIDGIVNRVFFNSLGAVVSSGEVIAEIVPTQGKLLVEAFIDPKDIAPVAKRFMILSFDSTSSKGIDFPL